MIDDKDAKYYGDYIFPIEYITFESKNKVCCDITITRREYRYLETVKVYLCQSGYNLVMDTMIKLTQKYPQNIIQDSPLSLSRSSSSSESSSSSSSSESSSSSSDTCDLSRSPSRGLSRSPSPIQGSVENGSDGSDTDNTDNTDDMDISEHMEYSSDNNNDNNNNDNNNNEINDDERSIKRRKIDISSDLETNQAEKTQPEKKRGWFSWLW